MLVLSSLWEENFSNLIALLEIYSLKRSQLFGRYSSGKLHQRKSNLFVYYSGSDNICQHISTSCLVIKVSKNVSAHWILCHIKHYTHCIHSLQLRRRIDTFWFSVFNVNDNIRSCFLFLKFLWWRDLKLINYFYWN